MIWNDCEYVNTNGDGRMTKMAMEPRLIADPSSLESDQLDTPIAWSGSAFTSTPQSLVQPRFTHQRLYDAISDAPAIANVGPFRPSIPYTIDHFNSSPVEYSRPYQTGYYAYETVLESLPREESMLNGSSIYTFHTQGLDTMHRPPTSFAVPTQDCPFSFMPTNTAQDFPPVILDMWTHDASVSLPSSSGGLDALLNTPRTSSKLWDHRQPDVSLPDAGKANDPESPKPSSTLVRPSGASRTPKRPLAKLVTYSVDAASPNNKDMTLPTSSPLRIRSPSARLPTISPVLASTDNQSSSVPPKKARLAAERGRRGDLREKFAKLRDKLPMGGQKGSKVNVLDRAMSFIDELTSISNAQAAQLRLLQAELGAKTQ